MTCCCASAMEVQAGTNPEGGLLAPSIDWIGWHTCHVRKVVEKLVAWQPRYVQCGPTRIGWLKKKKKPHCQQAGLGRSHSRWHQENITS